ncbi:MAG: hypothetical protein H7242_03640 [Microbacteriaceae bacterium]|nr:hypothetical protein [Burkholderiaceae bacterium]
MVACLWMADGQGKRLPVAPEQAARVAVEQVGGWAGLRRAADTTLAAATRAEELSASVAKPAQLVIAQPPAVQVAVCGRGFVDASVLESEQAPPWASDMERAAADSRQRVVQHLNASANDADRVVAALLAGDAAAAAKIAYRSSDATAYSLALGQCAKDASAACGLLSAARWAQLDAGNAAPWLALASAAWRRGDEAGLAEGLHRASVSSTLDFGYG